MGQCHRTSPFGWIVQPAKALRLFPPKADSRRPQVQTITQPQVEEKDCEARPPQPSTPSEEGGRNLFHLLGVGCHWSGILCKETPGRVFLVSRTLLPILPPVSVGGPGVINCLSPPQLPTLGVFLVSAM